MKVIFAKNIGFCFGVKRAMEFSEKSLEKDPKPVQFLGKVIHNEEIIKKIKGAGGNFISSLKQAKSGTLVIRGHGMPPFIPPENVLTRDFTCPLVKKAQLAAYSLFEKGYRVIIIGGKEHPEVKGIKGYAKNKAMIIENESQAKKIKKINKIGVVAQTTQDFNKVNRILKILREKGKNFQWIDTICPEVLSRQKELSQILKRADGILVIGSKTSANTRRLADIAKNSKSKVFWVNSLEDLKKQKLRGVSTLGVVSGTSAPNWEIKKIKKWLKDVKQK